jgi:nucleoside-diphosphate-sugar epimerase
MKVLVTGGGGFLGTEICRELKKRNYDVLSFSRNHYPSLTQLGVECRRGDLTNYNDVHKALEGVDAVIHCAALAGVWGKYDDYYSINYLGTAHVIKAMKSHGISTLVYTSSPSVVFGNRDLEGVDEKTPYPEKHYCTYAETKAKAEKLVLKQASDAFRTCSLRPHLIWGPGDPHIIPRLLAKARTNKLKQVGDGENLVDVIYVENAAVAHVDALEKLLTSPIMNGQAFFIGQDEPVKLWDFIRRILHIYEIDTELDQVSFKMAYGVGFILEKVYGAVGINKPEPPMTRFVALQLAKSHYFSHHKAKEYFHYKASVSTEQGLANVANSRQRDIVKQSIAVSEVSAQ